MNPRYLALIREDSPTILAIMVGVAFALWMVAMIWMVIQGFRQKSYGMPPLGIIGITGVSIICGWIGPWLQPELFFSTKDWVELLMWRLWAALGLVIYLQFLLWGFQTRHHWPKQLWPFRLVAVLALVLGTYGEWTLIIYLQDFYVNVTSAVGVLLMSIAYFFTLSHRINLRGLSLVAAWTIAVGTALLYLATVLGSMPAAFPHHEATGYAFIYWMFAVTIVALFTYAWLLTRRRNELDEKYDSSSSVQGS